jgi:hypothetical protein
MDRFGFLPCDWTFEFEDGEIRPIPEIDEVRKRVDKYTNEDGFLYPPLSHRVRLDRKTNRVLRKIPRTERPAHLHPVPPSHELRLRVSGTVEQVYLLTSSEFGFSFMIGGLIAVCQFECARPITFIVTKLRWNIFCLIVTEYGKAGLPRSKNLSPTYFSCILGLHPTSGTGSDLRLSTWYLMVAGS